MQLKLILKSGALAQLVKIWSVTVDTTVGKK